MRPPPSSTLFPYTTLFRSGGLRADRYGLETVAAVRGGAGALVQPRPLRAPGRGHHPPRPAARPRTHRPRAGDRKSTRLNSSHTVISYAVFCLKKKNKDADP